MNSTPQSNRTTIVLIGKRNAGKSSLMNALTGQQTALVSSHPGTTTDPVNKTSELHGLGPLLYIDTAGLDDEGDLGEKRVAKSFETLKKADAALLLVDSAFIDLEQEQQWIDHLKKQGIPYFLVMTKTDLTPLWQEQKKLMEHLTHQGVYPVNRDDETALTQLKQALIEKLGVSQQVMIADRLDPKQMVLLVMPQDRQAPKGRLILPQVQILRELLDYHIPVVCATFDNFSFILSSLSQKPQLIITDSQLFHKIKPLIDDNQPLTSFSVLMASQKGDINYYHQSTYAIEHFKQGDRLLILEACSHHAIDNDIARQQIPQKLSAYLGFPVEFDVHTGGTLPADIAQYKLAVQCGSCMINRAQSLSRLNELKANNIPVTNFGTLLAYLSGQLERAVRPLKSS